MPARGPETDGSFGASLDRPEHLAELWLDVFNTATLPFYWGRFEPARGRPDTERLRRTAQWFADRGVALNEAVIMPVFDKEDNGITRLCRSLGRIPTVRLAFEEARAAKPRATPLLNDFDLSSAFALTSTGAVEVRLR